MFLAYNCVIFSHGIMCSTTVESSQQCLHFIFSQRQAFSNLRGRYYPKTEKNVDLFLVTVSFLHIESSVIPLLKAVTNGFISPCYMDELWAICEDVMTKNLKIWWFLTVLCAVSFTFSVLSGFSLKIQTNQCMITFKVKVKFE